MPGLPFYLPEINLGKIPKSVSCHDNNTCIDNWDVKPFLAKIIHRELEWKERIKTKLYILP